MYPFSPTIFIECLICIMCCHSIWIHTKEKHIFCIPLGNRGQNGSNEIRQLDTEKWFPAHEKEQWETGNYLWGNKRWAKKLGIKIKQLHVSNFMFHSSMTAVQKPWQNKGLGQVKKQKGASGPWMEQLHREKGNFKFKR